MLRARFFMMVGTLIFLGSVAAQAATFSGTLFYTRFSGSPNVLKIDYSYDDVLQVFSLTNNTPVASLPGADGIIFDANGNLLVGGQAPTVHQFTGTTTPVTSQLSNSGGAFHLALDPSGSAVYTSNFSGDLAILPLTPGLQPGVLNNVTGVTGADDFGLTQIAFAPNGNVFYVNGNPNGFGNLGLINLSTFKTQRLHTSIEPAHGLLFDSYDGLLTIFGAGKTGTFDQLGGNLKLSPMDFTCDFDQGAVDGMGHALVAGCDAITFLDYRLSHDITAPNFFTVVGGFTNIDDVAPLSGLGSNPSQVPEPSSLLLLASGLVALIRFRRFFWR